MSLNGSKRYFSWKKAYAIIFAKFQVISSHFDKLPYFTPDFPTNQIMDSDLDKGEILKTYKNEFEWLKTIFFMKEGIRDHFCKVSSDLKPFWQVTIFHTRLPHKPNHGVGLRQGRNSENLQKWVWMALNDIFHEKRHTRSFWKVSSDFKQFWQVTLFHTRLPHKPNHGLGLRQGRNSENLQKWIWLAWNDFFRERRLTRSFLQSFKWFQAILTSYYISHQTSQKPNYGLGLRQGRNSENLQNEFDWVKTIFFMKKGIRDQFWKVSGDLKLFWQVTIFHTWVPHKPNHGLGLIQGWNSENLQKWVWLAKNDFFHEGRHTWPFLQSFKWFKAILTSYHISHQTSPQTKSWIGT